MSMECFHAQFSMKGGNIVDVLQEIEQNFDYTVATRRHLHAHPELSMAEFETAKFIRTELSKWGIPFTEVGTGTVAVIKGTKETPVVALRCDIDALPIKEVKDLPFKSQNEGVMHACGHDSHMAMLLTATKILSEHKAELPCTVKVVFQPAEETMKGALTILDSGLIDDIDTICGMHILPFLDAGKISVVAGPRYTSAGFMKIKIIGKAGHGAMPQYAVDPIFVGSKVVDALQSIVSRETNPMDTAVVSVCTFHSGTLANIFAETAELTGTVRTFNNELRSELPKMIERVIKNTCAAYRATYEFDYYTDIPATVNDSKASAVADKAVRALWGDKMFQDFPGTPGGEDFAYYQEKFPGIYAFVGCKNEAKDCIYSLHHDHFDLDEDAMKTGAAFYVQYVLEAARDFAKK